MPTVRLLARLVAAAVLAAAAGLALPTSPAAAASCSSSHGVTVVVDFHGLGGGVQTRCVGGGGGDSARALLGAAGFSLTDVQRTPGFVCRVEGKPASDPCVNTPPSDAYWGLWWSDGKSGSWSYGTRGVDSLSVPDGGYVALSWNGSSARSAPGVSPAPHRATSTKPSTKPNTKPSTKPGTKPGSKPSTRPKPSAQATPTPTRKPSAASTAPAATPSASSSASPSAGASATPSASGSTSASPSASAPGVSSSQEPTHVTVLQLSDPSDSDDGGLPAWVGLAVVALLLTAGAAVAVVRRRGRPTP